MGRGVSAGGGQSSLGYLFGNAKSGNNVQVAPNQGRAAHHESSQKPASSSPPIDKQIPAGIHGNLTNNYYFRVDGQNSGNFITYLMTGRSTLLPWLTTLQKYKASISKDRPSTKVHAAPGGGSSLDYLFGGGGRN